MTEKPTATNTGEAVIAAAAPTQTEGGSGSTSPTLAPAGSALRAHVAAHGLMCSLTALHHKQQQQRQQQHHHHNHHQEVELRRQEIAAVGDLDALDAADSLPLPLLAPPLLVTGPDVLHHLEASAVLGGVQYVYVASRLFAAAVWRLHLQVRAGEGCLVE